jgi:hypothetical protein
MTGQVTPRFTAVQNAFQRLVGNTSGGWADPAIGLSVGFITNHIGSLTTPLGDLTLDRLNRVVRECAASGPRA